MAKQTVGLGATANDGTGDSARVAFDKINDNFGEIYTAFGDGSALGSYQEVLSEGAFVDGDKTKLDGIATGATANSDESIQDLIGAMVTGNTETRITVTYQDADGTIDFVVDNDLSNYDNSTSGFITDYTVTEGDVTAHEAALTITESQISDLGTYSTATGVENNADVTDETNVTSALSGATLSNVTPALDDEVFILDTSDSGNLKGVLSGVQGLLAKGTVTSAGAPASAPDFVGQTFNDTSNGNIYIAAGTSSSSDWKLTTQSGGNFTFTATNNTGSTIAQGVPVKYTGTANEISVVDSDTPNTFPAIGITSESIADSATGEVVVLGEITGVDTSEFSPNDPLYVLGGGGGTLFGGATGAASEPTTGRVQQVAVVKGSNASGSILVSPQISGSATITQSIWAPANSMTPATTSGAEAVTRELATNDVDVDVLRFNHDTADEYAVFSVAMPKGWDEGTVTFQAFWTHTGASTNFGVTWGLQAIAFGNDDALDASWGTAVVVDDTGGTNDDVYVTAESGAVTIAGTPAEGDMVIFRVFRDVSDTNDDMASDADLLGVKVFYNANTLDES